MSEQTNDATREWITLGDFARRLGIARASVYGRIKRGTLEAKRANRGGYLVPWPPPDHDGSGDKAGDVALQASNGRADSSATVAYDVAALQIEVARLEERLAADERRENEFRTGFARERAALAERIADMAGSLVAERARADRLEAALDEARRPLLLRLVDGLRRKG